MLGTDNPAGRSRRAAIVIVALGLSGCSIFAPVAEPVESVSAPAPEPQPEIVILPPAPEPEPAIPVKIPVPTQLPPVAIVLTSGQAAYADVAEELAKRFEDYEIYDLSDSDRPPVTVLRQINDSESGAVIAIGLRAAKSSVALSEKPVVFSQVVNYQDHNLLIENSRGVAAIPPVDAQLAAWKKFDPAILRIGAIVGPGHDEIIAAAEFAAIELGLELHVQVTRSDQETLYFFKRMIHDVDGFWLFPDNRVLSRRALQEIMDDAQRLNVPVLVPNDSMLQIGASFSVTSVASDIAETITKVVRQIHSGNISRLPPITQLSEIRMRSNDLARVVDR